MAEKSDAYFEIEIGTQKAKDSLKDLNKTFDEFAKQAGKGQKTAGDKIKDAHEQAAEKTKFAYTNAMKAINTIMGGFFSSIGGAIRRQLTRLIGDAVDNFKNLDKGVREVTTLLDEDQIAELGGLEQLKDDARELSVLFGQDVTTSTKAMYQAISAGVPAGNLTETLEAAGKLSVGGVTTLETSIDGLTTAMNAYQLQTSQLGQITDTFFIGMQKGKTTVEELSNNMGKVAPIASTMGVSLQETVAAMSAITTQGVSTSQATTMLQGTLKGILKPSKAAEDQMKALGLEYGDNALKNQTLQEWLEKAKTKLNEQGKSFKDIFGNVRAYNGAVILAGNGNEKFKETVDAMNKSLENQGEVSDIAFKKIAEGVDFRMKQVQQNLQNQMGKVIEALLPAFEALVPVIESLIPALQGIGNILAAVFNSEIFMFFRNLSNVIIQGIAEIVNPVEVAKNRFAELSDEIIENQRQMEILSQIKFTEGNLTKESSEFVKNMELANQVSPEFAANLQLIADSSDNTAVKLARLNGMVGEYEKLELSGKQKEGALEEFSKAMGRTVLDIGHLTKEISKLEEKPVSLLSFQELTRLREAKTELSDLQDKLREAAQEQLSPLGITVEDVDELSNKMVSFADTTAGLFEAVGFEEAKTMELAFKNMFSSGLTFSEMINQSQEKLKAIISGTNEQVEQQAQTELEILELKKEQLQTSLEQAQVEFNIAPSAELEQQIISITNELKDIDTEIEIQINFNKAESEKEVTEVTNFINKKFDDLSERYKDVTVENFGDAWEEVENISHATIQAIKSDTIMTEQEKSDAVRNIEARTAEIKKGFLKEEMSVREIGLSLQTEINSMTNQETGALSVQVDEVRKLVKNYAALAAAKKQELTISISEAMATRAEAEVLRQEALALRNQSVTVSEGMTDIEIEKEYLANIKKAKILEETARLKDLQAKQDMARFEAELEAINQIASKLQSLPTETGASLKSAYDDAGTAANKYSNSTAETVTTNVKSAAEIALEESMKAMELYKLETEKQVKELMKNISDPRDLEEAILKLQSGRFEGLASLQQTIINNTTEEIDKRKAENELLDMQIEQLERQKALSNLSIQDQEKLISLQTKRNENILKEMELEGATKKELLEFELEANTKLIEENTKLMQMKIQAGESEEELKAVILDLLFREKELNEEILSIQKQIDDARKAALEKFEATIEAIDQLISERNLTDVQKEINRRVEQETKDYTNAIEEINKQIEEHYKNLEENGFPLLTRSQLNDLTDKRDELNQIIESIQEDINNQIAAEVTSDLWASRRDAIEEEYNMRLKLAQTQGATEEELQQIQLEMLNKLIGLRLQELKILGITKEEDELFLDLQNQRLDLQQQINGEQKNGVETLKEMSDIALDFANTLVKAFKDGSISGSEFEGLMGGLFNNLIGMAQQAAGPVFGAVIGIAQQVVGIGLQALERLFDDVDFEESLKDDIQEQEKITRNLEAQLSLYDALVKMNDELVDTARERYDYNQDIVDSLMQQLGFSGIDEAKDKLKALLEQKAALEDQISLLKEDLADTGFFEGIGEWFSGLFGTNKEESLELLELELEALDGQIENVEELLDLYGGLEGLQEAIYEEIEDNLKSEFDLIEKRAKLEGKTDDEILAIRLDNIAKLIQAKQTEMDALGYSTERENELLDLELERLDIQKELNEDTYDNLKSEFDLIEKRAKLEGKTDDEILAIRLDNIAKLIQAKQSEMDALGYSTERENELLDLELERLDIQKELNEELDTSTELYDEVVKQQVRSVIEARKLGDETKTNQAISSAASVLLSKGLTIEDVNAILGTDLTDTDAEGLLTEMGTTATTPSATAAQQIIASEIIPSADYLSQELNNLVTETNNILLNQTNILLNHTVLLQAIKTAINEKSFTVSTNADTTQIDSHIIKEFNNTRNNLLK